jgi:hypothetical protein
MADILTTTRATKPGAYIGRIFRPQPTGLSGFARLPCFVGKGSRLQTLYDIPIRRSYRNGVLLSFTSSAPHTATLAYTAVNDQNISTLYKEDGTPVSNLFWSFRESVVNSGNFDQVFITAEAYDSNSDYFIDYQSDSRTLQDELPFSDIREVRFVGDTEGQDKYIENVNYNIPVSMSSITANTSNANYNLHSFTTPVVTGTGTPVLSVSGTYTHNYNRVYTLDVLTVGGGFINAEVRITLGSGGNSVGAPAPYHTADTVATNGIATGAGIAFATPTVTLTVSGITLLTSDVGKTVVVSGATTAANNGYFTIASVNVGLNQITYTNASAVAEAYTGIVTVVRGQTVRFTVAASASKSAILDPVTNDIIRLSLSDTGVAASTDNLITFTGVGPSILEKDATLSNTNQYPEFSAVVETATDPTVALDVREDFTYTGTSNRNYIIVCTAASGLSGNRLATFRWVGYGEATTAHAVSTEGVINISESAATNLNATLELGIHLAFTFGTSNFTIGDKFTFTAKAPRRFVTAKDSRNYTITVTSTAANTVQVQYTTDTPEGRFGTAAISGTTGELRLPGGIFTYARNVGTLLAQNRYAANDEFTFSTINSNVIDWNLYSRINNEVFNTTEFYKDNLGLSTITGTVGATYVILSHTPIDGSVLSVRDAATQTLLTATHVLGTPIVWFLPSSAPTSSIEISYEYRGEEPSPGNFYYITANIKRPAELYNTPILSLTYDEALRLLGPSSKSNDLLIASELALRDNGAPGVYTCQAFDADSDGIISTSDINNAILATEGNNKITDIVVLNGNSSLATALLSNERMNDPFERKERALWVGLPVGTLIGSVTNAGSTVATAKKTLQVYGSNPAHGTRVLVANNKAVKTITLPDGSQSDVTLDGSFIQAAIAAKNASFPDPGTPLLRQFVSGFKSMQTFSESEELQLEAASVLYLSNQGSVAAPVFRIEESVTVDTSSSDNNEISVSINQRQYVTKSVRDQMDDSLVAIVPPSEQAGLAVVRTFLAQILRDLVTKGIIGAYTDDAGNERAFDPSTDIEVFRDTTTKTLYNFKYYWNGRYPIKRLFGLYSVDDKLFSQS